MTRGGDMRDNLLSDFFDPNQFTGAGHTQTVTLLAAIGVISGVILISIGVSLVVRHLTILSLRMSARTTRRNVARLLGKKL